MAWEDEEESRSDSANRSTYGDAEAAADLLTYQKRKRAVPIWAAVLAGIGALGLLAWAPAASIALAIGGVCGIGNMLLTMRGNERLVDSRRVGPFVISSFLRIGLFGIVAAALALREPLWTLGPFFIGFFLPLALYALIVWRAIKRK